MRGSMSREPEPSTSGARRRAGSCPPQGRTPPGPTISSAARTAIRSGLVAAGSQFRPNELGLGGTSPLAAGLGSNITARIISTDRGNLELTQRPPGVPGTLQLTVLVPVLLNTPRRTPEQVAGIGTTWTLGDAQISVRPEILSKLQITEEDGETEECEVSSSGLCDSCGICLQPFQPGENLTALPCATDLCPSVWHADCVRKWLCQGQTPTCPLCRSAIEIGDSSASAQSPSPSFALEVRAALPLSATSGLQAAFSSGRGTSNQLLQQLGQVIIQDILLLTLSQHTGQSGTSAPSLPHLASSGLLNGATSDASNALADFGGLLLQTLTTNGTLPVTLSAVETWGPGTGSPTHSETRRSHSVSDGWSKGRGRGGSAQTGGRGGRGKGHGKGQGKDGARGQWNRTAPRSSWREGDEDQSSSTTRWRRHSNWHAPERSSQEDSSSSNYWQGRRRHGPHATEESSSSHQWQGRQRHANAPEEASSSSTWQSRQRQWVPVTTRGSGGRHNGYGGKSQGKGASNYDNSWHGRSSNSWTSWNDWNHWDGGESQR